MKILFLTIFFLPQSLFAFTLNNSIAATFAEDTVTVNIANFDCTSTLGATTDELLSYVAEAGSIYWNNVPSSRIRIIAGSVKDVSTSFRDDLICQDDDVAACDVNSALVTDSGILISCNTNTDTTVDGNFSSNSVVAVTVNNSIDVGSKTIKSSVILINGRDGNSFSSLGKDQQVAVLAHEIGHAIGLGHSPVSDSLMHYLSNPTRKLLGQDDMDGATYLYPKEQPIGGCGSVDLIGPKSGSMILQLLFGIFLIGFIKKFYRVPRLLHSS